MSLHHLAIMTKPSPSCLLCFLCVLAIPFFDLLSNKYSEESIILSKGARYMYLGGGGGRGAKFPRGNIIILGGQIL